MNAPDRSGFVLLSPGGFMGSRLMPGAGSLVRMLLAGVAISGSSTYLRIVDRGAPRREEGVVDIGPWSGRTGSLRSPHASRAEPMDSRSCNRRHNAMVENAGSDGCGSNRPGGALKKRNHYNLYSAILSYGNNNSTSTRDQSPPG